MVGQHHHTWFHAFLWPLGFPLFPRIHVKTYLSIGKSLFWHLFIQILPTQIPKVRSVSPSLNMPQCSSKPLRVKASGLYKLKFLETRSRNLRLMGFLNESYTWKSLRISAISKWDFLKIFYTFICVRECGCMWIAHVPRGVHVAQLAEGASLLPLCEFWWSNSDHSVWWQVPFTHPVTSWAP